MYCIYPKYWDILFLYHTCRLFHYIWPIYTLIISFVTLFRWNEMCHPGKLCSFLGPECIPALKFQQIHFITCWCAKRKMLDGWPTVWTFNRCHILHYLLRPGRSNTYVIIVVGKKQKTQHKIQIMNRITLPSPLTLKLPVTTIDSSIRSHDHLTGNHNDHSK